MNGQSSSSANPSGVQGLCPQGWHVPSISEWTQLTDFVVGTLNSSDFQVLQNGQREFFGNFIDLSVYSYWYSSEDTPSLARFFRSSSSAPNIVDKVTGFSCRCLRD